MSSQPTRPARPGETAPTRIDRQSRLRDRAALVHPLDDVLPGEAHVLEAAEESLAGSRRGLRGVWPFLGPGFIASVAYIDPGNFATNMASGASYGYLLLWVVVMASLMAAHTQASAGRHTPPRHCHHRSDQAVSHARPRLLDRPRSQQHPAKGAYAVPDASSRQKPCSADVAPVW